MTNNKKKTKTISSKLPVNWIQVQLIDLLVSLETGSRPVGGVKQISSGIPSIGGEHLDTLGGFSFSSIKFIPHSFAQKMTRGKIEHNDILIVKDGATTGKTSFITSDFPYDLAFVNEHVFICRPSVLINSKYLFWFLWSAEGNKLILENFKGSAQGGINTTFASNCLIPLAPLEEQITIANYIDGLMEKLQTANVLLHQIPLMIKEAKQKILTAAVTGELTKDWRSKQVQNKEISWSKKRFGSVIKSIKSGKSIKCIERPPKGREIGIIKVSAVSWGKFDEEESKTIPDKKHFNENYIIHSGDFLFSRANTTELVGACVIVGDVQKQLMLSDKILRITFDGIQKEWALIYLRSRDGRNQIENVASGNQEAMKNISQEKINNIIIPVPSLLEQKEIIRKAFALLNKLEKVETTYIELNQKLKLVPSYILSNAFRGELIENIGEEENFEELIEKIAENKMIYAQTVREMKKIKTRENITNKTQKKNGLYQILKNKYSKRKFAFEDMKSMIKRLDYNDFKEEFFQLLKDGNLEMEYNAIQKTYDYSFTKKTLK